MIREVTLQQLNSFAAEIVLKLKHPVVLVNGDLGAGKTTFIKELVKSLGCTDEVSSPTFGIVNELRFANNVGYHFDLYRIEKIEELAQFGFEEYVNSGDYCFIEWPEIGAFYIPDNHHNITIKSINNTTRKIIFS